MRRTLHLLVLTLLVAILVAACGRGDNGEPDRTPAPNEPQRTVRPGQHGPIVKGDYELEGALQVSGEYTVLYSFADEKADTCGKIAGEDGAGYVVPLPTFKDARRFVWTAGIRQYRGPGAYDLGDLERLRLEYRKTPDAEPIEYVATKDARADLEVAEDNAGSFTFSGLENDDGDGISGEVTWTCEEGSEGKR